MAASTWAPAARRRDPSSRASASTPTRPGRCGGRRSGDSFEWYPKTGARQIATVAEWMAERQQELGNYGYAADMKKTDDEGMLDLLSMEYLIDEGACVVGTPADCIDACRRYEQAGVDLL